MQLQAATSPGSAPSCCSWCGLSSPLQDRELRACRSLLQGGPQHGQGCFNAEGAKLAARALRGAERCLEELVLAIPPSLQNHSCGVKG